MTYIVDGLGSDQRRYQAIADSDDYSEAVRQEAQVKAHYTTLLLLRIADGSLTLEHPDQPDA